jgi:hypothetical protein
MGKQVRFYMLLEDERAFLQFLLADPAVVLVKQDPTAREVQVLEDPLAHMQQRTRGDQVFVWNRAFPFHQDAIHVHRVRKYDDDESGSYIETGELSFSINPGLTCVIEYLPSFLWRDGKLVKGRIWADMERLVYGPDVTPDLVYKGAEFEAWYDSVATWLRRRFKRVKGVDGWFGRQALEWYRQGGELRP